MNEGKSDWSLSTTKESLGFTVDSADMRLKVPADKITAVVDMITSALAARQTSLGLVHSIWGTIQSLYPALQGASAYCYEIGRQVVAETGLGREGPDMITLSEAARSELVMLRSHIQMFGPRGMPVPCLLRQEVVWSDAGEFGYGGHLRAPEKEHHAILPPELIGTSSTRRELYGMRKVTLRLGDSLRGKKVLFLMDSRAGVQNMPNQGGTIRELNEGYREWLQLCNDLGIEPYFEWIPREQNQRADTLSKRVPLKWTLTPLAEEAVAKAFPGQAWTLPDLNHFGNVIAEAQQNGGDLLLVHPVWPASPWWNLITAFGTQRAELPDASKALMCKARGRAGPTPWKMRATLLSFPPRSSRSDQHRT